MRGFPVIYTRTKYKDYLTELLVRPFDLHDDAYKKISNSILGVGNNIRRVVFMSGVYCVWGISTTTNYIYNRLRDEGHDVSFAKEYLVEENGRPIPCFFGYAIPIGEDDSKSIPFEDDYKLFKMYIEQIKDVWESDPVNAKITDRFYTLNSTGPSKNEPRVESFRSAYSKVYPIPNDSDDVLRLYNYFTTRILSRENLSFITGINNRSAFDNTIFGNLQVPIEKRSEFSSNGLRQIIMSRVSQKNFKIAAIAAAAVAAGITIAAFLILYISNSNNRNLFNQRKAMDTSTVAPTVNTQMEP